jgi:DMSO reductase family type II enzyme heme b subunit
MRKTLGLIVAPTVIQPGLYVAKAYADRTVPSVRSATLEVEPGPQGRRVRVSWSCPTAVRELGQETDRFVDAAALAIPAAPDTPWVTMGAPGKPLEGVLWRADRAKPLRFHAEGLGSVKREAPPAHWKVLAEWTAGHWSVTFDLAPWPRLDQSPQLAVAIWRGAADDRGGLKSVSPGWVTVAP